MHFLAQGYDQEEPRGEAGLLESLLRHLYLPHQKHWEAGAQKEGQAGKGGPAMQDVPKFQSLQ